MTSEEFKKKRDSRTEDLISQIQRHDNTVANIVKSAYERGYADSVNTIMDNEPSYSNELARLFAFMCGQESVKSQIGTCKTCSHRDPEDKKCDCGGLERVGCQFPVSDDYYCKYYERRTWEAEEEVDDK